MRHFHIFSGKCSGILMLLLLLFICSIPGHAQDIKKKTVIQEELPDSSQDSELERMRMEREIDREVEAAGNLEQPFCHSSSISAGDLEEYITLDSDISQVVQGICVAEDYVIVTRWHDNNSSTEFKVFNPNATMARSFVGHAGHANSMAYNPDKHEILVAACDGSGRVLTYSFHKGSLKYKGSKVLPYNITKVCYVSSVKRYYLSTGVRMFSTKDFSEIRFEFETKAFATGQGMTSDGEHIYMCWTPAGKNVIKAFSLTGTFLKEYTIPGDVCRELEEIDFIDGNMIVADNRADADKIYMVKPTHSWTGWATTLPANCTHKGRSMRTCRKCSIQEEKILPVNNSHKEAAPVETPATCTSAGLRQIYCQLCNKLLEEEDLPAFGHDYSPWETTLRPTLHAPGQKERICRTCQYIDNKVISRIRPVIKTSHPALTIREGESQVLSLTLAEGDQIKTMTSDSPLVATIDETHRVWGWMEGYASLHIETEAGAQRDLLIHVIHAK